MKEHNLVEVFQLGRRRQKWTEMLSLFWSPAEVMKWTYVLDTHDNLGM